MSLKNTARKTLRGGGGVENTCGLGLTSQSNTLICPQEKSFVVLQSLTKLELHLLRLR